MPRPPVKAAPSPSPRLISLEQAAEFLQCNPRTIRRRIADGSLTSYRLGLKLIRVDADELTRLLVTGYPAGDRIA